MVFSKKLYMDDAALKQKNKIKYRLKFNKTQPSVYVLMMNPDTNRPEVINSIFLKQDYYRKQNLRVIGFASSQENAIQLLADIVSKSYTHDSNNKQEGEPE